MVGTENHVMLSQRSLASWMGRRYILFLDDLRLIIDQ